MTHRIGSASATGKGTYDSRPPKAYRSGGQKYYYVLLCEGGVELERYGPFTREEDGDATARALHARSDPETDAVFWMVVTCDTLRPGAPPHVEVGSYSGAFFGDDEEGGR